MISNVTQAFREKLEELGVEVIPIKRRHPLNPLTPLKLANILRKNKVDLVHAHSPTASLWGRIAAFLNKIPFVATVHLPVDQYHGDLQTIRPRLGRGLYIFLDRWLNHRKKLTKKLIFVSEEVYQKEVAVNQAPIDCSLVIPNGIDLTQFTHILREDARKYFNLRPDTKIVVYVGRLEKQKGVDILIQSISEICYPGTDFLVWLIGDGPLKEDLLNQVNTLDLSDIIHFWGYQKDIPSLLKASDIYVLPSRYEGMSFALLEGMAAGLPCVVTKVGENYKLINHGEHGLVVPVEDSSSLTDALTTLLVDPNLRSTMAKNVNNHVKQFSDEKMVKRIEQVYNECLNIPLEI